MTNYYVPIDCHELCQFHPDKIGLPKAVALAAIWRGPGSSRAEWTRKATIILGYEPVKTSMKRHEDHLREAVNTGWPEMIVNNPAEIAETTERMTRDEALAELAEGAATEPGQHWDLALDTVQRAPEKDWAKAYTEAFYDLGQIDHASVDPAYAEALRELAAAA